MSKIPSVLLLDDGELDRVRRLLERLGADFQHLSGEAIGPVVDQPRDLLITTGRRALDMPRINPLNQAEQPPTWICVHGHDVSDVRDKLRGLGVHFLVHSALDQTSLRLLLEQTLFQRAERRRAARLPMGVEVTYRIGNELDKGKLAELSKKGCCVLTPDRLYKDTKVWIYLPREISEQRKIGLSGRVRRSTPHEPQPGASWHSNVVIFEDLEQEAVALLESIFAGERAGTRVTPLEQLPGDELELTEADRDRRAHARHKYRRRMALLAAVGVEVPQVMLGRDLSRSGLRVARHPTLRLGMHIAVALYGDARSEPVVIQAEVVKDYGERGLGLQFHTVTPEQSQRVEALLAELPPVEEMCTADGSEGAGPVVVSRIVETDELHPDDD